MVKALDVGGVVHGEKQTSTSRTPSRRRALRFFPVDLRIALVYAALGVAFTWPVALHFTTHLPAARGAPPIVSWILSWQAHAITEAPGDLFNGPMFFPFENAILLSESMIGGVLLALPAWLITHQPPAMFNFLLLASFPIAAFGAYCLLRDITGSRVAGFAAGIAFGFSLYRIDEVAILHVALVMWLPYVPFFLHRFLHERKWRYALGAVIATWLQITSSGHGALMLGIGLLIFVPIMVAAHWRALRDRALWVRGAVALGVLVMALVPFVVPYNDLYRDNPQFRRDSSEIARYSATGNSFLVAPARSKIYQSQPLKSIARGNCAKDRNCLERTGREELFPGFAVLAVALGSLVLLWRSQREGRFWLLAFAVVTFVSGALSIGSDEPLRGPYGAAYRLIPGLDAIRVPGRLNVLTTLGLAGLVGLSVGALGRSKVLTGKRLGRLGGLLIVALLLVDVWPNPAYSVRAPRIPDVYKILGDSSSRSPMLELPTTQFRLDDRGVLRSDGSFEREPRYIYYQTEHWRPIVNGRSSNIPARYIATVGKIRGFPDARSIAHLRELGVGCVIVHRNLVRGTAWEDIVTRMRTQTDSIVIDDGVRFVVDVSLLHPVRRSARAGPTCLGP